MAYYKEVKPLHQIKIGNITLSPPIYQAALSGYSDRAMRMMARAHGAVLTFSGLMLDKSTAYRKVMMRPEYAITQDDHPVGGQLLGSDPDMMARAAKTLVEFGYDMIDLNFACPVQKVLRRGRGGAMLRQPEAVSRIYRRVRDTVNCPVTMKLRAGYGHSAESMDCFWHICDRAAHDNIDALIIHGRTVGEQYRGKANWDILDQVKQKYPNMTLIGSGDLFTADNVVNRLNQSKVDGVVIARGSIGNPWIFNEVNDLVRGKTPTKPTIAQQGLVIRQHFDLVCQHYTAKKAVALFRKFTVHYTKRHPNRKKVMLDFMAAKTTEKVHAVIDHWYHNTPQQITEPRP